MQGVGGSKPPVPIFFRNLPSVRFVLIRCRYLSHPNIWPFERLDVWAIESEKI